MTDAIIVSLIAGIASVLGISIKAAVDGHVARRDQAIAQSATASELAAIRHQVQNSHGTNLRDDIDKLSDTLSRIKHQQAEQADTFGGLRKDIGGLRAELRNVRSDITDIRESDTHAQSEHRSLWSAIQSIRRS